LLFKKTDLNLETIINLKKKNISKVEIVRNEQNHFSDRKNIWEWATTKAGQRRYDNRFILFKQICNPKKGDQILEIGCGDGEFTNRLIASDSTIIASDLTYEVLKRAQQKKVFMQAGNLSFKMDDAEFLSFRSDSLDTICGVSILHHLDYKKALKEAFRVLRTGGEIFFSEPNLLNPITITFFYFPWLRKKLGASPNETALIRWEVEKFLDETGFKEVRVLNNDFLFPWIPDFTINVVEKISMFLERVPLVKEISGSLIIYAKK
jgi:ubiquinone/menaquinone biosynthesis C-methylase UbiE